MVAPFNILLVNLACRDKRITDDDARVVPIGLYYIAALLIENGFIVQILNLADDRNDPVKTFNQAVSQFKPDLTGFSVTNPSRMNAIECAARLKRRLPDSRVVFGGPAPTFLADHLFAACPALDFIIKGEGEKTVLELATALRDKKDNGFETIRGIAFRKTGQLVHTAPRPAITDLDSLPHPSAYFVFNHLSMSRGCPGKCTFCGSPGFWTDRTVRFHSPEWMIREIKTLMEKGITHFYLSDDTFTMDKDRVLAFCRQILEADLTFTWNAISRVDYIDAEMLAAMRKAGCIQISYGVESGSETIRKTLGKPIDRQTIIRAFEQTAFYGILPRAYFIYGSPGETDATIEESIELMHRIRPLSAIFYMLVIFPGTYLYNRARRKRIVSDDLWHQPIEDLPWFELDDRLDFNRVKTFGNRLREAFYTHIHQYAAAVSLVNDKDLYPFHADFLSRLALTFSHGEYAAHPKVDRAEETAVQLFEKALAYAPDARAFLGLAMLHQKNRRFEDAVRTLTNGLSYFCENKDLHICMGVCLMNMGAFNRALPYLEKFKSSADADHYIRICRQKV